MSLNKRLFPAAAAASDGYTENLTSWIQVGTGKSWEGSGTSMTDLSSNSNNFTLQGGYSYTSGNNFVSLTANSGNIVSSVNLTYNSAYTIFLWYNTTFVSAFSTLLGGNSSNINYFATGPTSSSFTNESFSCYTDYGATQENGGPLSGHGAYADGTWRNLTLTNSSGTNLKSFMNGSVAFNYGSNKYWSTPSLSIGRYSSSNIAHEGILFGQIRVYSVVLTDQQITDTYNATKGIYGL